MSFASKWKSRTWRKGVCVAGDREAANNARVDALDSMLALCTDIDTLMEVPNVDEMMEQRRW